MRLVQRAPMFARRWMTRASAAFGVALLSWMPREVQAQKQPVDWEALNPAFQGATFVNDAQVCQACHEDAVRGFGATPHARLFRAGRMADRGECESCHGPRSKHIENPGREFAWASLSADQQSTVCLQCHEGGARMGWKAGTHLAADVS